LDLLNLFTVELIQTLRSVNGQECWHPLAFELTINWYLLSLHGFGTHVHYNSW